MSTANTILIADDDREILSLLEGVLSKADYSVLTTERPRKALDLLLEHEIALALVDVKMPGMDGIELTKLMKDADPDICVLIITAYPDVDQAVKAMRVGAEDYIVKPFNVDEVALSVERSLHKRQLIIENRGYQTQLEQKVREKTSELAEANLALTGTKEYLENLIESSADGIITTDKGGRVTFASKSALEMFGWTSRELVGQFAHVHCLQGKREAKRIMKSLRKPGRLSDYETEVVRKDGSAVTVSLSISFMSDKTGRPIGTLIICKDITERKKLERNLRELSIKDSLTGLYNQRHFYERLEVEIERAKRQGHPLSLLLFDIDHFKGYNDRHGHLAGDKVLEKVGEIVRECTREHVDSGYRYGGDEFTVILSETTQEQAFSIAERLRISFKSRKFDGLTLSAGLMPYNARFSADVFIKRADEAMYGSKRSGGDQVYILSMG